MAKAKKVKIVRAKFTGSDNSLGYQSGRTYILKVEGNTINRISDGEGVCKYSNIDTFTDNWTDISNVE